MTSQISRPQRAPEMPEDIIERVCRVVIENKHRFGESLANVMSREIVRALDAAGLVIRDRRNILNTAIAASPEGDEVLAVTDPEFPSMLYGWTDDDGIYRFTDDPSQVPGSFDPTATPEGEGEINVELPQRSEINGFRHSHHWTEIFDGLWWCDLCGEFAGPHAGAARAAIIAYTTPEAEGETK